MKKEAIVDRIEGKVAVLLTDDEEEIHIPAAWFDDMHEGMAIDMEFTENPEREKESMESAEDLLADIKKMNGIIIKGLQRCNHYCGLFYYGNLLRCHISFAAGRAAA